MVNWSGGEETRSGHFTPKMRIFQEVLRTAIRWTPKPASTKKKKIDHLGFLPSLLGGDRLTLGEKTSDRLREPGAESAGQSRSQTWGSSDFAADRPPALNGQQLN